MKIIRIKAIFKKDFKDFLKNPSISLTVLIAPLFALLYLFLFDGTEIPISMQYLLFGLAYTGSATNSLSIIISEEKEKGTLQNLISSPALGSEILLGKSIVSIIMTVFSVGITALILRPENLLSIEVIIAHLLLLLIFILLGLFNGLISSSLSMVNLLNILEMIIFTMSPTLEIILENNFLEKIISYLPLNQAIKIHTGDNILQPIGILMVWGIVLGIMTLISYRKNFQ